MTDEYSSEPYYSSDNFESPTAVDSSPKESKRVMELFIGGILVVLLILMCVLFIGLADGKSSSSEKTVVSNSYNSNSYNEVDVVSQPKQKVYTTKRISEIRVIKQAGSKETRYYPLKFSSSSQHRVTDDFFGDIDRYSVYVRNTDCVPGYFTVRINFGGYYDDDTILLTKYIYPGEEEVFYYQKRCGDSSGWSYSVDSESKVSEREDYSRKVVKYEYPQTGCCGSNRYVY